MELCVVFLGTVKYISCMILDLNYGTTLFSNMRSDLRHFMRNFEEWFNCVLFVTRGVVF